MTGAEALDHVQVAKLISAEIGKEIQYQEISAEDMRGNLLQAGLPAD